MIQFYMYLKRINIVQLYGVYVIWAKDDWVSDNWVYDLGVETIGLGELGVLIILCKNRQLDARQFGA